MICEIKVEKDMLHNANAVSWQVEKSLFEYV